MARVGGATTVLGFSVFASRSLIASFRAIALSNLHRLYFDGLPPLPFIAAAMQVAVVDAAKGYSELVTDLAPKCARLSKLDVVSIRRTPAADRQACEHTKSRSWAMRLPERSSAPRAVISTV
jgi:hypothetical protein